MKEIVLGISAVVTTGLGMHPQKSPITFNRNIRPIFEAKCLPCHSSKTNVGPFDFSTYQGVTSRIELIRTQVLSQAMPPVWAHSDFGKFATIDPVTDEEAVQLQEWIRNKMPEGLPASELTRNGFVDQKSHSDRNDGKQSMTLSLAKGKKTRMEGLPYWQVHEMPLPLKGGKFGSLEITPTNPRVIRYATVAIVPNDLRLPENTTGSLDLPAKYLVGTWAPGYPKIAMPKDLFRSFGPNQKLVVQVHYRPTGKPEAASFGVSFSAPDTVSRKEPSWITMEKRDLVIPAGKSEVVELSYLADKQFTLLSVLPEARFYAGRVQLLLKSPDGQTKTLFDDMRWDPYWIGNFSYSQPVIITKGSTLTAKFYYDNDEFCRINEGKKPKPVKAGSGAGDEVCRMHLRIAP